MISHNVLAATLLVALPSLAVAQSSLQIYGRIDMSLNAVKFDGGSSRKSLSSDTSLFGFRGSEDLGGGLAAYFKLESGFNADNGTNANPAVFFNRESYVGLRHLQYGSVQLGSQWAPTIWISGRNDPFLRGQMGAQFTVLQGPNNRGYAVQFPNAIQYITPNFSGLQGRAMYQLREGAAAANRAFGLDYTRDAFSISLAYDSSELAGATLGVPARPTVRSDNLSIGGNYNFGFAKLLAYVQNNRVSGLPGVTGYMLGTAIPMGSGEIRASYSHSNNPGAEAQLIALGYNHFLSKRTQVYVTAAQVRNDGSARFGLFPSSTDGGVPIAGQDARGVQVGIRHTF